MGAALARKVLGEGQSGVCAKFDIVSTVAVALVCSLTPCGRSGRVLVVGHFLSCLLVLFKRCSSLASRCVECEYVAVVYSSVIIDSAFGDAGVVGWFVSRCVGPLVG